MADPDNTFKNHIITIKSLHGKKRYEFIWEYYKIHILMIIVGAILLFSALNHYIFNPPKKEYANISIYGGYIDGKTMDDIKIGLELIIPEEERENYEIYGETFFLSADNPQLGNSIMQKFAAMVSYQGLDCLLIEKSFFSELVAMGLLMDLADYFTEEEIELLSQGQDKIMYGQIIEEDVSHDERPYGILCKNSEFLEELGFMTDNIVVGVVVNTKKPDISRSIVDVILGLN